MTTRYLDKVYYIIPVIVYLLVANRNNIAGERIEIKSVYKFHKVHLKITIITPTHLKRISNLYKLIDHYKTFKSDVVSDLFIYWTDESPVPSKSIFSGIPFRVKIFKQNSIVDRFKINEEVRTSAILSLDDDFFVSEDEINRLYNIWYAKTNHYVVGISGRRYVNRKPYYVTKPRKYNMVLTNLAITGIDYCSTLYQERWSDTYLLASLFEGVEDIFFNLINRMASNQSPLLIDLKFNDIKGSSPGYSSKALHYRKRELFVQTMLKLFPLLNKL